MATVHGIARCGRVLVLVLALAGCAAEPLPSPTASPPAPPTPATPLATIDPGELAGGRVACGGGSPFAAAALDGAGGAELGTGPIADALRAIVADSGDPQLPRAGWHAVDVTDSRAVFVARWFGGGGWSMIELDRTESGWTPNAVGQCRLNVLIGAGVGHASWWVDPATPAPGPDAREIHVLVQEDTCAGGRAPVGRVAPPLITYRSDAIVVVVGVVPLDGEQDCPGAPPAPFTLRLDEPLGNRALLDGGVVPPRDASKPPVDEPLG